MYRNIYILIAVFSPTLLMACYIIIITIITQRTRTRTAVKGGRQSKSETGRGFISVNIRGVDSVGSTQTGKHKHVPTQSEPKATHSPDPPRNKHRFNEF